MTPYSHLSLIITFLAGKYFFTHLDYFRDEICFTILNFDFYLFLFHFLFKIFYDVVLNYHLASTNFWRSILIVYDDSRYFDR